MARIRGFTDRMCIVCGHNLGPYGRICDKCGSIQRPVRGDGMPLPPDEFKACEKCGQPMPVEIPEDICEDCASSTDVAPVVWVEDEDPHRKLRVTALVSSVVAASATCGAAIAVALVGAHAVALVVLLVLATVTLGASVASWVIISRRPAHKIDYYPPVKPGQPT